MYKEIKNRPITEHIYSQRKGNQTETKAIEEQTAIKEYISYL